MLIRDLTFLCTTFLCIKMCIVIVNVVVLYCVVGKRLPPPGLGRPRTPTRELRTRSWWYKGLNLCGLRSTPQRKRFNHYKGLTYKAAKAHPGNDPWPRRTSPPMTLLVRGPHYTHVYLLHAVYSRSWLYWGEPSASTQNPNASISKQHHCRRTWQGRGRPHNSPNRAPNRLPLLCRC